MFDFIFGRKKQKKKLFFNTDMHCHLIPGVDDGSPDVATSVHLIKGLNEIGIDNFVATPHVTALKFENNRDSLREPLAMLKRALEADEVNVSLAQSAEYRIDDFYRNNVLAAKDFMPMPGNHILLESNWIQEPLNLSNVVYDTSLCGFKVIFAHPERYRYLNESYHRYAQLHERNMMFQVNLLSFSGFYGGAVRATAFRLLDDGMVDFIGTDTHNEIFLKEILRFMGTKDYRQVASKCERYGILNDTAFLG